MSKLILATETGGYYNIQGSIIKKDNDKTTLIHGAAEHLELFDSMVLVQAPMQIVAKAANIDNSQRVTTGVVMSPYRVDSHGDYASPLQVRDAARRFTKGGMAVELQHLIPITSQVVENYTMIYPTPQDEANAMAELPHRAFRFNYSDGSVIHSGDWVTRMEHSEAVWDAIQAGTFNGFSPEFWLIKGPEGPAILPDVTFIDINGEIK